MLLLIEISRNFVTCLSGPTLFLWLATPLQKSGVCCGGYLQGRVLRRRQAACWKVVWPECPCSPEGLMFIFLPFGFCSRESVGLLLASM